MNNLKQLVDILMNSDGLSTDQLIDMHAIKREADRMNDELTQSKKDMHRVSRAYDEMVWEQQKSAATIQDLEKQIELKDLSNTSLLLELRKMQQQINDYLKREV